MSLSGPACSTCRRGELCSGLEGEPTVGTQGDPPFPRLNVKAGVLEYHAGAVLPLGEEVPSEG